MSTIRLILTEGLQQVRISNVDSSPGAWGAILRLILEAGGTLDRADLLIDPSQFRAVARRMATTCAEMSVQAELNDSVERLLRVHLDELAAVHNLKKQPVCESSAQAVEHIRHVLRTSPTWNPPEDLTDQQYANLASLVRMMHGANFSVPGAGKTRATLALHSYLRETGVVSRLLIIGPKNAFGSWEEEVARCLSATRSTRLISGEQASRVLLTDPKTLLVTYQLIPNVLASLMSWLSRGRVHIVLDESHRIKRGYDGAISREVMKLSSSAIRRDILTGTPLPHSANDLDPQFKFLWPGQDVVPRPTPKDTFLERVRSSVRPLYVRTTKKELNLPDPDVRSVPVPMGEFQREIYEALRNRFREQFGQVSRADQAKFRALGRYTVRLLQAASNPALLTKSDFSVQSDHLEIPKGSRLWELCEEYARYERPAKVWAAINRAVELQQKQRKSVIWTSFVPNVEGIAKRLAHLGAVYIHGQVPSSEDEGTESREGRIRRFHDDPDCWIMVANPAAAAEGISLHRVCHHAIYVDRTFNAAHYLQSIDRIHRLGLPSGTETTVEILTAAGTIDEEVQQSLARKTLTMAAVLDDHHLARLAIDADEAEAIPGGLDNYDLIAVIKHLERAGHL